MLSCQHAYCRTCLATHVARQARHEQPASCPLCKAELDEREVEAFGEPKEELEESETEGEDGLFVYVEGDNGEPGFYVRFGSDGEEEEDEETVQAAMDEFYCEWSLAYDGTGEGASPPPREPPPPQP